MTSSRSVMQEVAPHLAELSSSVLFGDIWERPGLSKRDRSLVTMVTMIALHRTDQLRGQLSRALDNGVTKGEIGEIIPTWPSTLAGLQRPMRSRWPRRSSTGSRGA